MFTSQELIQSLKIYWSWGWRIVVYSLIVCICAVPVLLCATVACAFAFTMGPNSIWPYVLGAVFFVGIFFYCYFIISQKAFEEITKIAYRGFKVNIMRDGVPLSSISKMDSFCLVWSLSWRPCLISLFFRGFIFVFYLFFSTLSIKDSFVAIMTNKFISLFLLWIWPISLLWVIKKKKTGRCIRIEDMPVIQENKRDQGILSSQELIQSAKIYWSWTWRMIFFQILVFIMLGLLIACMLLGNSEPLIHALELILAFSALIFSIYFMLNANKNFFEKLSKIKYKTLIRD